MLQTFQKSLLLLFLAVVICCGIYPLVLWTIGQVFFPFQANGSILADSHGNSVGSLLIAQSFTQDEYFHPRPSAASYNAAASASSSLAASNYALRNRVANSLGTIVKYQTGVKAGQLVAPDIEAWFQKDIFDGNNNIVAQWAMLHTSLAQAWVNSDPSHSAYVDNWAKTHPSQVKEFIKYNPYTPSPQTTDLAVTFFQNFSTENPGRFPSTVGNKIEAARVGADIQSVFFDMWRQDHPDVKLQNVPADMVMASASGLDPHITLQNALFQLDRVASKWASNLKRDTNAIKNEINQILNNKSSAPLAGLAGEKIVNVLEVNLELQKRYGVV